MSETLISMLPLLLMTLIFFFVNRWIGIRCKVWTPGIMIFSLIPVINYLAILVIFVKAIQGLTKRIEDLEAASEVKPRY
jgi:hypothetical protein